MSGDFIGVAGGVVAALFPLVNPIGAVPVFMSLSGQLDSAARRRQALRTAVFVALILLVSALAGRIVLQIFGLSVGTLQVAGGLIVANTAWKMATGAPRMSSTERKAVARSQRRAKRSLSDRLRENLALISEGHLHVGAEQHGSADEGSTPTGSDSSESAAAIANPATASHAASTPTSAAVSTPAAAPAPRIATPDFAFTPLAMPLLAGPGSIGVVVGLMSQNATLAGDVGIIVGIVVISLIVGICLLASDGLVRVLGDSGILAMQRVFGFIVLAIAVALIAHGVATLFGLQLFILVPS